MFFLEVGKQRIHVFGVFFHAFFKLRLFGFLFGFLDFLETGLVHFKRLCGRTVADELDAVHFIALYNRIDHCLPDDHVAEHGVQSVEVWRGAVGDKKLAAVGAAAVGVGRFRALGIGVCHGQDAGTFVGEILAGFIRKIIAGAATTRACRTAALNHKVRNHAVEIQPVIIGLALRAICKILGALGEANEAGDGHGRFLKLQLRDDGAFGGGEFDVQAIAQIRFGRFCG